MDSVVKPGAKLDTVVGERPNLWLYIHGPAHHWAISAKRDAAVLLPAAEMFATVNSVLSGGFAAYPQQKLSDAWEASIYPDHGWGGKNGDITDQIFREKFEYARSIAWQALSESIKSISAKIKTADIGRPLIVFNDLSWQRDGIVKIAMNNVNSPFVIKDGSGSVMPHQICNDQIYFAAAAVPSIGYKTYYLVDLPGNAKISAMSVGKTASSYENNYFKVSFAQGGLKSIFDKQAKRQLLKTDKFLAGEVFSMQSIGNGAGEFVKIQMPSMEGFDKGGNHNSQWTLVESGKIRDVFELRYSFVDCDIIEKAIFYKQFKKIDFEIDVKNWAARHNRELRVAFPLALPNGNIAYEAPMGILKVGKDEMKGSPGGWTAEGSYTQNVPEIHPREVQNFITAYNKNYAITIGGSVAVWDYIDPTTNPVDYPVLQPLLLATRKSCHSEGNWYLQKGDHSYRFSLMPYKADWKQAWQAGIESNHSFYAAVNPTRNADADLPVEKSFFSLSAKNVVISAIKKCEDDNSVIVRVYEIEGTDAKFLLKTPIKISAATKTNIIEENGKPLPANVDLLKIRVGKYAIETFKLLRQGN
jgi:alpha-mannosidase